MKVCIHCNAPVEPSVFRERLAIDHYLFTGCVDSLKCTNCGEQYISGPSLEEFQDLVARTILTHRLNTPWALHFLAKAQRTESVKPIEPEDWHLPISKYERLRSRCSHWGGKWYIRCWSGLPMRVEGYYPWGKVSFASAGAQLPRYFNGPEKRLWEMQMEAFGTRFLHFYDDQEATPHRTIRTIMNNAMVAFGDRFDYRQGEGPEDVSVWGGGKKAP